jgi:hypothetical protein
MDFSLSRVVPLVGSQFTVQTTHGAFPLTLVEASEGRRQGLPEHLRTPLSLIFDGPTGIELVHDNYLIAHPALGEHVLNIAPVMRQGLPPEGVAGPQYQILFA